jgi:DNA replication protein DnaC
MKDVELERMNIPKRFWDASFEGLREKEQDLVKKYLTEVFPKFDGKGLLLYGPEGTGKTQISCVIAKLVREKGYYVYFLPAEEATYRGLFQVFDGDAVIRDRCKTVDLLIIDDLNFASDQETLYSLLKFRANGMLPTILTTRVSFEELPVETDGRKKQYSFKGWFDKYFPKLVPVLHGNTLPLPIQGENYREKEQKKYAEMLT